MYQTEEHGAERRIPSGKHLLGRQDHRERSAQENRAKPSIQGKGRQGCGFPNKCGAAVGQRNQTHRVLGGWSSLILIKELANQSR